MSTPRQLYIEQYSVEAMRQMRLYGIPASITLAQAIIESGDGHSTVAVTANNHFGIKGEYNGQYVLANDDKPNEKFKKYESVSQGFDDHSKILFLERYQKYTRDLSPDDYKSWAKAIKQGGYASDDDYVAKLIGVIEKNNLQRFDQQVLNEKTTYSMPVKRDEFLLVTSPYGQRVDPMDKNRMQIHHGIDIKVRGEAILATENNGTVIGVDNRTTTAGGKTVTVEYNREDGSKVHVQYMHLSKIDVKKGDVVQAGQALGITGNTGTRTTGEHLHFGVIKVNPEGKQQWVNPAAYLAEINQRGNLNIEVQHNGKNLLSQYSFEESLNKVTKPVTTTETTTGAKTDEQQTAANWLTHLMMSDDSALEIGNREGGLLESIFQMFMTLMMLSLNLDKRDEEEKMGDVTKSVVERRIDLSDFAPNLKSAELQFHDGGKVVLNISDDRQQNSHTLTEAEKARLSQILHSDIDDAVKQQRIGSMINAISFSQQAALRYDQIEQQQQTQDRTLQIR